MKYGNIKKDNFILEIKANDTDDFQQLSVINGLNVRNGGTHIDFILEKIVLPIRDKLIKKFKTIKPADIKNKLKILSVCRFFPALEFTSQEKIEVSNSRADWNEFFNTVDWDKIVRQLLKDEDLMLNITEYFSLKEKAKENAEIKKLSKKVKIKSDKYLKSIKRQKYLFLVEGESALGGLLPVFGRDEIGYYVLKGKPLNAYSSSTKKFAENKELSELFKVIKNEQYDYIVTATDADLDGIHINGLLLAFIERYLPEIKSKFGRLNTPVMISKKNKKLVSWSYGFDNSPKADDGETLKWMKGLGSWKEKDLIQVVETDTINKMIELYNFDDVGSIDEWFNDQRANDRKTHIENNSFDLTKL